MDERIRDLERRAATGDIQAQAQLLREYYRSSQISYYQILLLSNVQWEPALELLEPEDFTRAQRKLDLLPSIKISENNVSQSPIRASAVDLYFDLEQWINSFTVISSNLHQRAFPTEAAFDAQSTYFHWMLVAIGWALCQEVFPIYKNLQNTDAYEATNLLKDDVITSMYWAIEYWLLTEIAGNRTNYPFDIDRTAAGELFTRFDELFAVSALDMSNPYWNLRWAGGCITSIHWLLHQRKGWVLQLELLSNAANHATHALLNRENQWIPTISRQVLYEVILEIEELIKSSAIEFIMSHPVPRLSPRFGGVIY